MGKTKKKENKLHINSLNKPTKINEGQHVFLFSINSIENLSCGKSLQAVKNEYSITIRNTKSHE